MPNFSSVSSQNESETTVKKAGPSLNKSAVKNAIKWTCLYALMHVLIFRSLSTLTGLGRRLSRPDVHRLTSKFGQILNACICFSGASYLLFYRRAFEGERNLLVYPKLLDTLFPAFSAYCFYDLGLGLAWAPGLPYSLWFHHISGIFGAMLMTCYKEAAFFPLTFLLTEFTELFTALVWIVSKLLEKQDGILLKLECLRLVSFLCTRTFLAPLSIYYAYRQYRLQKKTRIEHSLTLGNVDSSDDRVLTVAVDFDKDENASFVEKLIRLNRVVSIGSTINILLLGSLNVYWTWQLFRRVLSKSK